MLILSNNESVSTVIVESGLDFILSHIEGQGQLFPRVISTLKSDNKHITVYSREEALQYYKESDFLDCKINAYPLYTGFREIQRYPPNFIFIDLDLANFKSERALKLALDKTLKTIKQKINGFPTVLFSGGGYRVYQPIESTIVLENITEFNRFDDPSQRFLKFAEKYLTNDKADPLHNPKFKSCMIRIPGSFNSKYNSENNINDNKSSQVKIIQNWNGYRPRIKKLIGNYLAYLIDLESRQEKELRKLNHFRNNTQTTENTIPWIEKLLKTPIEDGRKYTLWRIMCPYLVNVKKLQYEESFEILKTWLEKCNRLRELSFNADKEIKNKLRYVKQYNPISCKTLMADNKNLYLLLRQQITIK